MVAVVALANREGWALVVRGGGSADGWGLPLRRAPLVVLETSALSGIVAHAPGDLTVRVLAGTPLAELNAALAPQGQLLACEPPGAAATVGGLVAADAWGPSRLLYGGPRDLLLGARAVDGAGRAFSAGARVVKNVSGLDVGKLLVGSFGTLAVLTEVCFKLRPRPRSAACLAFAFEAPARALEAARAVLDGDFQPTGLVVCDGTCAVRLEGGLPEVADQAARLARLCAAGTALAPAEAERVWADGARPAPGPLVRCDVPDGALPALAQAVAAGPHALRCTAWPGLGVLWCALPPAAQGMRASEVLSLLGRLRELAEAAGGRALTAGFPPEVRAQAPPFGEPGELLPWFAALKGRFDPQGVLAPGRYVGGL